MESLIVVASRIDVVLLRTVLRSPGTIKIVALIVYLEVWHWFCDLIDSCVHCFEILTLRVLILIFDQRLILPIVFKDHLLWYLMLVSVSLISDLTYGILIDIVLILVIIFLVNWGELAWISLRVKVMDEFVVSGFQSLCRNFFFLRNFLNISFV